MTSLSLNRHPARALRPGLLGILLSLLALLLLALFSIGCSAGQQPTATVSVDVAPLLEGAVESDVGYAVTLTGARLSVADILLKDGEDEHTVAGLLRSLGELVIPSAHAHPGHGAGGVVIGELLGRRIVDFGGGRVTLGEAEAVLADLDSVDFLLSAATADDVGDDDPLLGHAAVLTGSATDGERTVVFEARIGVDDDTAVQGAPLSRATAARSPSRFRSATPSRTTRSSTASTSARRPTPRVWRARPRSRSCSCLVTPTTTACVGGSSATTTTLCSRRRPCDPLLHVRLRFAHPRRRLRRR